jgi:hypothetical protein
MYDVLTGANFTTPVVWESGFGTGVKARSVSDYWMVFAYRDQFEDTLHVFSYSRESGNFSTFMIKNDGPSGWAHSRNLFRIRIQDSIEPDKWLLYSPKFDIWHEKNMTGTSYWGGEGDYFYVNYTGQNYTQFYDGFTNQEYLLPPAQTYQHVFARDSVFLVYTNTGKYIGYSTQKHDTSEYVMPKLTGQSWANYIVLAMNIGGGSSLLYQHLLYDGFTNNFAPLILDAQHGIRKNAWPGGKTAIVMSENGYLFAYYPGSITAIKEWDEEHYVAPVTFKLFQNYPNPFNSMTRIEFQIPKAGVVSLNVYNILGQRIETLVNEKQTAGKHEVVWNTTDMASGIYFYRLETGDFIKTRKMVLTR